MEANCWSNELICNRLCLNQYFFTTEAQSFLLQT